MEKKKTIVPIIISIIAIILILVGASYAWFTLQLNGTKSNILRAGNLALTLEDETSVGINEENALPMLDEDGEQTEPYHFTLKNEGTVASEYTIYLDDDAIEETDERMSDTAIKYQLDKNGTKTTALLSTIKTDTTRILESGKINGNTEISYDLRLWLDENATNEVAGQVFKGKIRIEAVQTQPKRNENIVAVYEYNSTTCLTGEESTCNEIGPQTTYTTGTIIKYKVNDTEEKYFHVMYDNGDRLTLQQRENTINATKWYSTPDNTKGPLTVLPLLEEATKNWTNVKDQIYTMGTTVFKTNAFTGCDYAGCTTNAYTLPERTAKARMITVQEAIELGCKDQSTKSCPIWMRNYLSASVSSGGTVNFGSDKGYWTMSSDTSTAYTPYCIKADILTGHNATDTYYGARAVVIINK